MLAQKVGTGILTKRLTTYSVGMGLLNQPSDMHGAQRGHITQMEVTDAAKDVHRVPLRKAKTSMKGTVGEKPKDGKHF